MWAGLKKITKRFLARPAGRRFLYAYLAINKLINRNVLLKFAFFIVGLFSLLLGVIMLVTPGPGLLFIFIGGLLLCVISKKIANFFDQLEISGHELKRKYWK